MNIAWLNAKTINQSLPAIVNAVNNIMSIHKNEKGLFILRHILIFSTSIYKKEYQQRKCN
jgi:hypothetical protein